MGDGELKARSSSEGLRREDEDRADHQGLQESAGHGEGDELEAGASGDQAVSGAPGVRALGLMVGEVALEKAYGGDSDEREGDEKRGSAKQPDESGGSILWAIRAVEEATETQR